MAAATSFIAAAAPAGVPLPAEPIHRLLVTATVLPLMSICWTHVLVVLCCCRAATAAAGGAAAALAHPIGIPLPLPLPVRALAPPACQGTRSVAAEHNTKASSCLPTGACQTLQCCKPGDSRFFVNVTLQVRARFPQLHAQTAAPPGSIPVVVIPGAPVRISLPPAAIFTL